MDYTPNHPFAANPQSVLPSSCEFNFGATLEAEEGAGSEAG